MGKPRRFWPESPGDVAVGRRADAQRGFSLLDVVGQEQEPVALSALTASELLHRVHRAVGQQRRRQRERFVEAILSRFPVVEFGLEAARVHARLWAELAGREEVVGAHDLIIAATAMSLDFRVVTSDERDFPRIPGLRVHVWGR